MVIQALERYYDQALGEWRQQAKPFLKGADDIESKAAGLVKFYGQVVQYQASNLDLEGLLSLFEHDRTHFSKMVASLIPIMNMLTSGPLGPLLSPNPNDTDDPRPITNTGHIIEKAQVAYTAWIHYRMAWSAAPSAQSCSPIWRQLLETYTTTVYRTDW